MSLKNLFIIPAAVLALSACTNIAEDDRYIDTGVFTPARAVLIEDFTGQKCPNCPEAHEVIEALEEQYNTDGQVWVIPVSIHAGKFAISERRGGLGTPDGEEYNAHWGVNKWPQGVVDRMGSPTNYDQWATQCRKDMASPATMSLGLSAEKASDNKGATVTVSVNPEVSAKAYLQVWVIESGIVAEQQYGNDVIENYVHNNVFRAAVNGAWGEEIEFTATELVDRTYTVDFSDKWNPDNLSIVAFVYDSKGVLVVNRTDVK